MMIMPFVSPYFGASVAAPYEFIYSLYESVGDAVKTYTDVPIGTATAGRVVVVVVTQATGNTRGVSSLTINGVSANVVKSPNNTSSTCIASLFVPTGTTADIQITFNGSVAWRAFAVFTLDGVASDSPTSSAGSATADSLSVNVTQGGVVIGAYGFDFGGYTSISGVAEDVNVDGKLVCGGHEVLYDNAAYNVSVVGTSGRDSLIVGHFS